MPNIINLERAKDAQYVIQSMKQLSSINFLHNFVSIYLVRKYN